MEGIYRVIQIRYGDFFPHLGLNNSEFELFLLGEDKVRAGDRFGFLNDIPYNIIVLGDGHGGAVKCVIQTEDKEAFLVPEEVQMAYLFKRMNMYSGDADWGPYRPRRQGDMARILKEHFGGDQQTIIDTIKAIHEIYEGTK